MHYTFFNLLLPFIPMVCFGFMWFFTTKATKKMEPLQSLFLFQLIGIPMLLIIFPFASSVSKTIDLPLLIFIGILETFVMGLYFYALRIGELTIIGPINQANILVTFSLGILLLHESLIFFKILGVVAVLIGVILLSLQLHTMKKTKSLRLYRGVLPALLSAMGTGICYIFIDMAAKNSGWYYSALWIRTAITVTIFVIFLLQRKNIAAVFRHVPWGWIIPAAIFDVIGFCSFNYALSKYELSYVSVVIAGAPIITVTLAYLFLKEKLRYYQIIGLILVIFGLISLHLK